MQDNDRSQATDNPRRRDRDTNLEMRATAACNWILRVPGLFVFPRYNVEPRRPCCRAVWSIGRISPATNGIRRRIGMCNEFANKSKRFRPQAECPECDRCEAKRGAGDQN